MAKKELNTNQLAWVVLIAVVLVSTLLVISGNNIIGKIIYGYTGSAECKDYDANDRFPDGKNFGEASSTTKGKSAFFDHCNLESVVKITGNLVLKVNSL